MSAEQRYTKEEMEKRDMLACERLSNAPAWIQTIKVADLISNTSSIVQHDPKFAVTYLAEKRQLLSVLKKANPLLLEIAWKQTEANIDGKFFTLTVDVICGYY